MAFLDDILRVRLYSLLFLACLGLMPRAGMEARVSQLDNLRFSNPKLQRLRKEIALNLRSTARGRGLQIPLRVLRYKVQENDNFFVIMARVSQDLDTLVSLNGLSNPNALQKGQVLWIPNARGRFVRRPPKHGSTQKQAILRLFLKQRSKQMVFYFLPGERMPLSERQYFRGQGFLQPLRYTRISSRFGRRFDPFRNVRTFHGGLDLAAKTGTPVYATRAGRVLRAAHTKGGYGKLVVLEHKFGYSSWYGHLSKIFVKKGDNIQAGQKIGLVGSSGRSTGPHLHFEIRKNGHRKNPQGLVHFRSGK